MTSLWSFYNAKRHNKRNGSDKIANLHGALYLDVWTECQRSYRVMLDTCWSTWLIVSFVNLRWGPWFRCVGSLRVLQAAYVNR